MLAELHGDAPSEVNDSRLCRSVCQRARIASLPPGDAAVVDYAARLLRASCLTSRAQNCIDDVVEILNKDRLYSIAGGRRASIIEEAVHPSPLCDTYIDDALSIGFSRNVSLDEVAPIGSERTVRISPSCARRPQTTILAPSATNCSAVHRPIPLVAPMGITIFPSRRCVRHYSLIFRSLAMCCMNFLAEMQHTLVLLTYSKYTLNSRQARNRALSAAGEAAPMPK